MTKSELIDAMADKSGLTKKDVSAALAAFQDTIVEALLKGDSVALVGFGTFSVTHRKERTGRNPQTGADIILPAKNVPQFKAGKILKDAVQ